MNSMVNKKAAKREKMMNMPSYRLMVGAATVSYTHLVRPIQLAECNFLHKAVHIEIESSVA